MRRRVLLAAALLVTACGTTDAAPDAARETPTSTASPDAATPSAGETDAVGPEDQPGSPTASDAASDAPSAGPSDGPTPSEPASPTAAGSAPPSQEGAPVPAPPGTYSYDTDGHSQTADQERRPMPDVTTLDVSEPYNGAKQDRRRDLRDDEGVGSVTTTFFQHAGDGTYLTGLLLETTVEFLGSQYTDTRDLVAMPPALVAPSDLQPGDVATFHLEGDEMQADGTMTFVRQETVLVGTQEVLTNVIDVDVTFSGSVEGRSDSTWWVRPDDLLLIREIADTEGRQGTVSFSSHQESTLRSLTPE